MSHLLLTVRLLFVAQLLFVAVDLTFRTLLSLSAVLVVFYLTREKDVSPHSAGSSNVARKLRAGKHEDEEDVVPKNVVSAYHQQIVDFTLRYDPETSSTLQHFMPVQEGTECIFAKAARLWGAQDWNNNLSLEENAERSIPALIKFLATGLFCQLDGFVFELPALEYGASPEEFGRGVRRLLTYISEADPAGVHCMRRSYIGGRGWYFEFSGVSMFVTTFAPCYGDQHSRHAFDVDGCFVLFQPEYSFAAKNLPADSPVTDWDNPQTVRDRIRVAYRQAGRGYLIRDSLFYSPALDIVKPLHGESDDAIEWWKKDAV